MKTSRVKAYYQDYMWAVNSYGHRKVSDCYKNPSWAKVRAERVIADEMYSKDGYGYSVISYNTSIFTCGYLFKRNGELWFAVHTPSDYGEMIIKGDFNMGIWKIVYKTESGYEDEVEVCAVNKFMAWDMFQDIVKDFDEKVISADCFREMKVEED